MQWNTKARIFKKPVTWAIPIMLVAVLLVTGVLNSNSIVDTVTDAAKSVFTIGTDTAYAAGTPDYTCDGVADDVEIQAAVNALPADGGRICILAGTYNFTATVTRAIDDVIIEGVGAGVVINRNGAAALFSAGAQDGWSFRDFETDAGGITVAAATHCTFINMTIGTDYYAYWSSEDITSNEWQTPTGRGDTIIVAASDADDREIAQADYLCDGAADDVQIQDAMDELAGAGGTVRLSTGTFAIATALDMPSGITLKGQGSSTIIANGNGIKPIQNTASVTDITIENIYFYNSSATDYETIIINPITETSENIRVLNCKFDNVKVLAYYSTYFLFMGNYSYDIVHSATPQYACAIQVTYGDHTIITGNSATACEGQAYIANQNDDVVITSNTAIDCATAGADATAIDAGLSRGVSITGNTLQGCPRGILSEDSSGVVVIDGNTIEGAALTSGTGIKIWRTGNGEDKCTSGIISNNIISYTSTGIQVSDEASITISSNRLFDLGSSGIKATCTGGWDATEERIIICDNNVYDYAQVTTFQYGIAANGMDYVDIHGNNVEALSPGTNSYGIYTNAASMPNSYIYNNRAVGSDNATYTIPTDAKAYGNIGYVHPGEIRQVSKAITAGIQNTVTSIQNTFGSNVIIIEAYVYISTAASATNPTYDMGTDDDGAGAPSVGNNLFDAIPDTVGYYRSTSNGLSGGASGVQTQPIVWTTSGNDWVNFIITDAAGSDTAGRIYITFMGR